MHILCFPKVRKVDEVKKKAFLIFLFVYIENFIIIINYGKTSFLSSVCVCVCVGAKSCIRAFKVLSAEIETAFSYNFPSRSHPVPCLICVFMAFGNCLWMQLKFYKLFTFDL